MPSLILVFPRNGFSIVHMYCPSALQYWSVEMDQGRALCLLGWQGSLSARSRSDQKSLYLILASWNLREWGFLALSRLLLARSIALNCLVQIPVIGSKSLKI